MQNHDNRAKHIIPWLFPSVIAKIKVKKCWGGFWPCFKLRFCPVRATASSLRVITKEKKYAGKRNSTSMTSSHQRGSQGYGGQNKHSPHRNQGVQGVQWEGLVSFCGSTSLASRRTFTKRTMRVTNLGEFFFPLVSYVAEWRGMFAVMRDP